jgi:hypothetical protein
MEIAVVDKKLKKIITVFEAFKADSKISKLERDLLLGYLRDIYELVLDNENATSHQSTPPEQKESKQNKDNEKSSYNNSPEVSQNIDVQSSISSSIALKEAAQLINQPSSEPAILSIDKEPMKPSIQSPTKETSDLSSSLESKSLSQEPISPIEEDQIKPAIDEQPIVLTSTVIVTNKTISTSSENQKLNKLFVINKGSDISEKLAMSPISDIGKSMGLNERMFTITELFSGDSNLFNKTIEELNRFTSFDEAISYLTVHLAIHQKWDHDAKWEKAHTFVKLVRRRYPA